MKNNLNALTKILLVLIFSILIFIVDKLPVAFGMTAIIVIICIIKKYPYDNARIFKTLAVLIIFIILIQTIFGHGENYILNPLFPQNFPLIGGRGSLKKEGFFMGLTISCRLISLMAAFNIFIKSTSPYQIAAAISSIGVNYKAGFIITTALNFIPVLEKEGSLILEAQKMRGMDLDSQKSFLKKIKALCFLVVPLVLGAMRKSQAVSVAMDSRAFGIYNKRTWIDKKSMTVYDYCFLSASIILFIAVIFLNFYMNQEFMWKR